MLADERGIATDHSQERPELLGTVMTALRLPLRIVGGAMESAPRTASDEAWAAPLVVLSRVLRALPPDLLEEVWNTKFDGTQLIGISQVCHRSCGCG